MYVLVFGLVPSHTLTLRPPRYMHITHNRAWAHCSSCCGQACTFEGCVLCLSVCLSVCLIHTVHVKLFAHDCVAPSRDEMVFIYLHARERERVVRMYVYVYGRPRFEPVAGKGRKKNPPASMECNTCMMQHRRRSDVRCLPPWCSPF